MPKNTIHVNYPRQDAFDVIMDDYNVKCEKLHKYEDFLKELRSSLVRECSLIGGSAMVRDKIDKFLEENK